MAVYLCLANKQCDTLNLLSVWTDIGLIIVLNSSEDHLNLVLLSFTHKEQIEKQFTELSVKLKPLDFKTF